MLSSCATPQKLMDDTSVERIIFGRTGGFTNIPTQYVLFENRDLCKMEYENTVKICRISREKSKGIESELSGMGFGNLNVSEPGNMTYFIRVIKKDYQNEVRWSDNDRNSQLKKLYESLMALVKEK